MSASYTIKHVIDRLALWAGSHSSYFLDMLNGNIQLTVRKLAPNETTNTHVNHTMEVSLSCYFPCKHLTKEENKRKPKPWPHNNNKLRKYTPTKGQRLFLNCMECYLEVIRHYSNLVNEYYYPTVVVRDINIPYAKSAYERARLE